MRYTTLPNSNIKVSKICLGTMTYGKQNSELEGHLQMDYAFERGVNFFDTAELYPVPACEKTQGETERIIGTWLKKTSKRDKVILASKVAGPGSYTSHIRDNLSFKKEHINEAVNKSLARLKTDYIDLYQLHWPERSTNTFGQRGFKLDEDDTWQENFEEVLLTLKELISSGKIRKIGLSNENPWGLMKFLELSKKNLPKMITIQNPYSLLNRIFEVGNSEICIREEVGLLAYSPLAFGILSGKYRENKLPKNSRLELFPNFKRYSSNNAIQATEKYYEIALENNISLTELSLAYVTDRPFVTSNIIGATTMEQLTENINSVEIKLNSEIIKKIEKVQNLIPDPSP
ncbi:MAG: aldo/keto reductase [Flavobacteriaceae bacterium TMED220]|nr:MAG: aldo/keto reductase [Flavobacteriaceae bacterium TMED220]|tara:strand:+ start:853 stop:1890 length:1038 start_codon:yes stop_codon:yes gene_type:complete